MITPVGGGVSEPIADGTVRSSAAATATPQILPFITFLPSPPALDSGPYRLLTVKGTTLDVDVLPSHPRAIATRWTGSLRR